MARTRAEIPKEDCWNVEAFYPSWETWEADEATLAPRQGVPAWKGLAQFQGRLGEGPALLASLWECYFSFSRRLVKLYTYAHLRHDEDMGEDRAKEAESRSMELLHAFREASAWIEPELLALPEEKVRSWLEDSRLAEYRNHMNRLLRMRPHTLSSDQEALLAMAGGPLQVAHKTFGVLSQIDMRFPNVANASGEELELTQGTYQLHMRSEDRTLRRNAFFAMYQTLASYEHTFCELIGGELKAHWFEARARKYPSSLAAALYPHQIDPSVYDALVATVRERLPSQHRYMAVRKKVMKVPQMHLYDIHHSLSKGGNGPLLPYAEAEDLVIQSVAPLGRQYQETLAKGLKADRWVDRYENTKKRSGAYSSGCYDSMPFILMNYHGTERDVFTLAHEAGHSMHSLYSRRAQGYPDHQYAIFVAEVASTVGEELLFHHWLSQITSSEQRGALIQQRIDDMRATLLRQTMFAEFEKWAHHAVEKGIPLTPKVLKEYFYRLNEDYFGPAVVIDPEIAVEWARIPHFYYNFYVYQYATGLSAACAIAQQILAGDGEATRKYLSFLEGGCSRYPLELLLGAGVDMQTGRPVVEAMDRFDQLVAEWELLACK